MRLTVLTVLLVGLEVFGGLNVLNSFVSSFFNPLCFLTQCEKATCHCWYRCGVLQFFKCFDVDNGNHLLWLMLIW